uniref:Uncharacterized protein n=1 Tax=Anguilla anguilla TaxID=7936 RepID=A0A0E9SI08_ANGAN
MANIRPSPRWCPVTSHSTKADEDVDQEDTRYNCSIIGLGRCKNFQTDFNN